MLEVESKNAQKSKPGGTTCTVLSPLCCVLSNCPNKACISACATLRTQKPTSVDIPKDAPSHYNCMFLVTSHFFTFLNDTLVRLLFLIKLINKQEKSALNSNITVQEKLFLMVTHKMDMPPTASCSIGRGQPRPVQLLNNRHRPAS